MLWAWVVLGGGGLGAGARYGVNLWMANQFAPTFPWATTTVNVVGCVHHWDRGRAGGRDRLHGVPLRTFLAVGVLGGFTTFSSFSLETLRLWEGGNPWLASVNVFASVGLCLLAATLGIAVARSLK